MRYRIPSAASRQPGSPNKPGGKAPIHQGRLAWVFVLFGLLGLLTAIYFDGTEGIVVPQTRSDGTVPGKGAAFLAGPIQVLRYNVSYTIAVQAKLDTGMDSYIEGQVLDSEQKYLFSFGDQVWKEWDEAKNGYSLDITFPKPGNYFIRLLSDAKTPNFLSSVSMQIAKNNGNPNPHFIFSILAFLTGIVLHERENHSLAKYFALIKQHGEERS